MIPLKQADLTPAVVKKVVRALRHADIAATRALASGDSAMPGGVLHRLRVEIEAIERSVR